MIGGEHPTHGRDLPHRLVVYDIPGPLFFGAAHKATSQLFSFDRRDVRLVLVDLEDVPAMERDGHREPALGHPPPPDRRHRSVAS